MPAGSVHQGEQSKAVQNINKNLFKARKEVDILKNKIAMKKNMIMEKQVDEVNQDYDDEFDIPEMSHENKN